MKLIKYTWIFLLFFCVTKGVSQDYERVDATIQLYPTQFNSAEELSRFIERDFTSEDEKVRAIYGWIIQNVVYDPEEYKQFNFHFTNYRERNQKEEKTREKIIKRTLKKGIAVCEGYAMVFEKLCELSGISNYLVRGDTKTNFKDIGRPFNKNHMWNVAMINGEPFLFDPTWGAGRFNQKFIKEPSYFYFKTQPELFFKTHYPDMYEDAFMKEEVSRTDFSLLPIIIAKELLPEDIESPKTGFINTQDYFDEILFSIKNSNAQTVGYSYEFEEIKIDTIEKEGNTLTFSVPIVLSVRNLLIYFDGKPALGYKLK